MSRTLYLGLNEGEIIARCLKEKVGVSAIERLPGGGVRLVCNSGEGAERIRKLFKSRLLEDQEGARAPHRPSKPLW